MQHTVRLLTFLASAAIAGPSSSCGDAGAQSGTTPGTTTPVQAVAHRSPADSAGRFTYWLDLPGVQPIDHDIQGLWSDERGSFVVALDPGARILRMHAFAATDVGKVFEGDIMVRTIEGRLLAAWAPHKEQPFECWDGWLQERRPDFVVPYDDPRLTIEWVCRVTGQRYDVLTREATGEVETRCHFGMYFDAEQP